MRDIQILCINTMIHEFELAKSKKTLSSIRAKIDCVYEGLSENTSEELLSKMSALELELDLEADVFYKLGGEYYNNCLIPTLQKVSMYIDCAKKAVGNSNMSHYLDEALSEIEWFFSENT